MSLAPFAADASALPTILPSPFALPPHPVARRAADEMLAALRAGQLGVDLAALARDGKMFGVLVVRAPDGTLGYLRAFSGMLEGAWERPGFVPPLFDTAARDAMWPAGQAALRAHETALRALLADPAHAAALAALETFDREHARDLAALQATHRARRAARKTARDTAADAARLALDQASRADAAERRTFDAAQAARREGLAARAAVFTAERARLEQQRADESRGLMQQVLDHYTIENARGERRPLRTLFAPSEPAGGAGDCAAPKLLGHAYRHGLTPIALAEVWLGAPPATGGRHDGAFYPACRGKCGPLLPFMLEGLAHAPVPQFGADAIDAGEPRVVATASDLVLVDKPVGLLSVPGRSGALRDSVQTRLRARHPAATGPMIVHRLDLDTSGLLLVALTAEVHTALQAMFARHEIAKTYVAIVAGEVRGEAGTIALPLRVDLDDRPRQIVDAVHGKVAITDWRVLAREGARTRVALSPRTGRTHQLRVHCAHAAGLGAPIVGDRLYAADHHGEPRMLLHAERLRFVHPATGVLVDVSAPAPF